MYTKGTFIDPSASSYEPKYILALQACIDIKNLLRTTVYIIGVTFFDVSTLKIHIGQFKDDETFTALRTLICQIRPVEVIIENDMQCKEILPLLKIPTIPPIINKIRPRKMYSA